MIYDIYTSFFFVNCCFLQTITLQKTCVLCAQLPDNNKTEVHIICVFIDSDPINHCDVTDVIDLTRFAAEIQLVCGCDKS